MYKEMFNAFAPEYDYVTKDWDAPLLLRTIIKKNVNLNLSERVLDVGIGTGQSLTALNSDGVQQYGCDFAHNMLRITRKKYKDVRLIQADITEGLPFCDNWFDIVSCCGVLEFVKDYKRAISELVRIGKYGGHIAFTAELREDKEQEELQLAQGLIVYRRLRADIERVISNKIVGYQSSIVYQRPNFRGELEQVVYGAWLLVK
jgi:ubiquinone/menaquinone biosynthesis C-methylase UbiE